MRSESIVRRNGASQEGVDFMCDPSPIDSAAGLYFDLQAAPGRGLHLLQHHEIVRGVVSYVEENYAASISLRHVAQALGYSPAHLTHMFSSLTGVPVTAWIIKRRLFAAQELLIETMQDVTNVCEAVGFKDVSYFTRQFVRHVGVTPIQFRSANKMR